MKSASTMKLFSNAAMNDHYTYGRLYGCKIYEEGELVRDYAPICQGGIDDAAEIGGFIETALPLIDCMALSDHCAS